VRLFVAVWPPAEIIDQVGRLHRPDDPDLRWTTVDQWHVTLVFIGNVETTAVADISEHLGRLDGSGGLDVSLGPVTAWFPGRRVLQIPVCGLEPLHLRVRDALSSVASIARQIDDGGRPFSGHLTLARTRGQRRLGRALADSLAGVDIAASWRATSLSLVSSTLGSNGATYDVVRTVELDRSDLIDSL
jgi:RNA 2',3'-cyclic 3'-phosphodiesterase